MLDNYLRPHAGISSHYAPALVMKGIAMTINAFFDGACLEGPDGPAHRRWNRPHRVGARLTQSIASRLRDQFPMIHPLMLAAVAAESEWGYYTEEPREDHTDTTTNLPGMDAKETAAVQAPAEDETSLMETSVV